MPTLDLRREADRRRVACGDVYSAPVINMIGRAAESAAVARFTERIPGGPVGLLIEGEPGIGKTTVLLEAVRAARERRYPVLQARPAEAESELSFAALGDLVGDRFDEVRDALPAPQRRALEAALMLREADEPTDPLTTGSALLTALTILSRADPLVIAIDDAHWMDQPSSRALEFSVRRLPQRVGVVVASRVDSGPATPLDLERALGPGRLERLLLTPMSLAALHHLLESRLGLNLSRPMLVRVAEASGGNPYFALEISQALARDSTQPVVGDLLPVPRTLQDLLGDRVDRLSTAAREVASAAAALSRPTAETVIDGTATSPSIVHQVFRPDGTFAGTETLIRADLFARQPCPTDQWLPVPPWLPTPTYYACHHFAFTP